MSFTLKKWRRAGRAEERVEGRAEERKSAIHTLIITLKELSIDQSKAVEQVMKKYSLTRSQAQEAVQANW